MTWRANGNYYTFKQETIELYAPSASGVYGLYNMRHQILIENSANIRNALLCHLSETHFRFRRFTPTGFIFEVVPPEARELRTQELIREYEPILQTNGSIGLTALWRSWMAPRALAFYPQLAAAKMAVAESCKPRAIHNEEKRLRRSHLDRERFAIIAVRFGAILLAVGLMTLASHFKNASNVAREISSFMGNSILHLKGSAYIAGLISPGSLASPKPLREETKAFGPNTHVQIPHQAEIGNDQPKPEIFVTSDAVTSKNSMSRENQMAFLATEEKTAHEPRVERTNSWTVQAMATPNKSIASHWVDRLKAKGYQAFVVKADIKGQTWYRVRTGNFSTLQEAESLRTALKSTEGFHDAFVAANTGSETRIAINSNQGFSK